MKWLLLAVATLIALGLLAALLGAMTPRDHHATRKARFRQSPETLYAAISGPPDWRSDVRRYGTLPDKNGRKVWWEEDSHNQKVKYELVEDSPPVRRVVRIADPDLPFGGTWTFEISPFEGGAELRIHEKGEIYNVIFRFVARFFMGYTSTIETYLRDFGRKFGERVTIEP